MIVMKFGGTSVESAAAIEKAASIVRARLARKPVVVVSAMGKTTNKLLAIAAEAVKGNRDAALALLEDLHQFHLKEGRAVVGPERLADLEGTIDGLFQELEDLVKGVAVMGELTARATDAISSYGERLSSEIVAIAFDNMGIPSAHVDARDVIVTDARHMQAAPVLPSTYSRLAATIP